MPFKNQEFGTAKHSITTTVATTILVVSLTIVCQDQARAEFGEGWEDAKSYTSSIGAGVASTALAAVTLAKQHLASAERSLRQAKAALAGARAAAATWLAVQAVVEAEAVVAAAEAAVAAAVAAAEVVAAVAAGAAIGTLIGQPLSAAFRWCWDPVCKVTPNINVAGQPVYAPATESEITELVPVLIYAATKIEMKKADFEAAEDTGRLAWSFIAEGTSLFIGATRGAAAANSNRPKEVLVAATDMMPKLIGYAKTIGKFADSAEGVSIKSPLAQVEDAKLQFDLHMEQARNRILANPNAPGFHEILARLESSEAFFEAAQKAVSQVVAQPIFGQGGLIPDQTLDMFKSFTQACATNGASCLPSDEVIISQLLLQAAEVSFDTSFSKQLAAWDGEGDVTGMEALWFGPQEVASLPQLLRKSVETALANQGPWLNIELDSIHSQLVREAETALATSTTP